MVCSVTQYASYYMIKLYITQISLGTFCSRYALGVCLEFTIFVMEEIDLLLYFVVVSKCANNNYVGLCVYMSWCIVYRLFLWFLVIVINDTNICWGVSSSCYILYYAQWNQYVYIFCYVKFNMMMWNWIYLIKFYAVNIVVPSSFNDSEDFWEKLYQRKSAEVRTNDPFQ